MVVEERVFSGRYRVLGLIGEGGMARVYKAVDERLRRVVAIKTLHTVYSHHPELIARFEREARLAAGLSHPNIIGIYDIASDESGAHYIVMEYVEGENLKRLIGHAAPLALPECVQIFSQLCLALDYAHAHGVIHRDVKPENIFLNEARQVKVGDFGIARALDSTGITSTGMVMGSASYLSPEQAQGQPSRAQSDLYAAGIVQFEMLTGRLPFSANTPLAMAMKHVNEMPPSPSSINPHLPPGLDAVVLKALAKAPEARYQSGAAMVEALEREVSHATIPVVTPPRTPVVQEGSVPAPVDARTDARAPAVGEQRPAGSMQVGRGPAERVPIGRVPIGRVGLPARPGVRPMPIGATVRSSVRRSHAVLAPLALAALLLGGIAAVIAAAHGVPAAVGYHSPPVTHTTATRHTTRPPAATTSSRGTTPGRSHSGGSSPGSNPLNTHHAVVPISAVSAARRARSAHSQHATQSRAHRRQRGSAPRLRVSLTIARGEDGTTDNYKPVHPTTRFDIGATYAYAVAHWSGRGSPHSFIFRWSAPGGTGDSYPLSTPGYNVTGSAYAQIPLLATGTYHVSLYVDRRRVAQRTFTVVPDNAVLSNGAPTGTSAAGNAAVSAPTAVPTTGPAYVTPTSPPSTAPRGPSSGNTPGAPIGAIEQAVSYANDVYMQVMNNRDTAGVDAAFGAALANANRGVALSLAARHEHYAIQLLGLSFSDVTMLSPTTARVTVVKTESDPLYSDAGSLIQPGGAYTIRLVDIVQQIDGRWLVTAVYH